MTQRLRPDSGPLPAAATTKGQAYQAMIDYHKDGNLMGVYGEGIGGFGRSATSPSATRSP